MKVSHWMSCIAVGVGLFGALPAAAYEYRFSLLPTLGGDYTEIGSINNAGQVAGWSSISNNGNHWASVWTNGVPTRLPSSLGVVTSSAQGINDLGQVVGSTAGQDGSRHATLWNDGVPTELGPLSPNYSVGTAINDRGQVVGTLGPSSPIPDGRGRPTLWDGGQTIDLSTLGRDYGRASAINNLGQVVGTSYTVGSRDERPTLWHDGTVTDLGTIDAGGSASALDINDAGQVVGWSGTLEGYQQATMWSGGAIIDLGMLPGGYYSHATAINASGQVVGHSADSEEYAQATIWKGTTIMKLEDLVDPSTLPTGWTMQVAVDINDNGVIAGNAYYTGPENYGRRGFVLTPVPEPDTVVLLLAGLGLLAGAARHRRYGAATTALAVPAASDDTQPGRCRPV